VDGVRHGAGFMGLKPVTEAVLDLVAEIADFEGFLRKLF
jgi:hypothetical protein